MIFVEGKIHNLRIVEGEKEGITRIDVIDANVRRVLLLEEKLHVSIIFLSGKSSCRGYGIIGRQDETVVSFLREQTNCCFVIL